MITTRHLLWRKLPMNLHTLATSQGWMPAMDTGQLSLIRNPAYSQPSTALLIDTISCVFPLDLSVLNIFQKKMDQILEECQGCIEITDDITVHGCTKVEHDACLRNLMFVTHKYGLVFNPQKTHVKAPAVNFFGGLYDADGVHPDPDKVNAIHTLPAPTNITELQEFLGKVMYLSPFILACQPLLLYCMNCSRKTQTSSGIAPMKPPSSVSRMLSSVTPPSGTSTLYFP